MTTPLPPGNASATILAEAHLSAVDARLAGLIDRLGPCPLGAVRREPFDALVVDIIGQQLSTKAAATLRARLEAHLGVARPFRPEHLVPHSPNPSGRPASPAPRHGRCCTWPPEWTVARFRSTSGSPGPTKA